jgi:hypothetical protein
MQTEEEKTVKEQEYRENQGIAGKISPTGKITPATETVPGSTAKLPGRNDQCHCGNDRKYKKCCMEKDLDLIREAEAEQAQDRLIRMCDGRLTFQLPEAIKMLGAHSDGWMANHLDDIKYLKAVIRALQTFPTQGSDSFVMLHGEIFTRDDLITEYKGCLAEMEGKLARKDYQIEYALCEFMKKDAFYTKEKPEGDIPDRMGYDPNFELEEEQCAK